MALSRFFSAAALGLAAVMVPVSAAGAVTLSTTLSTDGAYVVSWSETLAAGDLLSLCEKHNLRPWTCQGAPAAGSRPFTGKGTGVWQYKTAIDRVGGTHVESAVVGLEVHLPTDVGVIAGESMCPDGNSPLWVFLDTNDGGSVGSGGGSSYVSGWAGLTWLDSNKNLTLNFCRVDGRDFKPLIDTNSNLSPTSDYAVLKLGSQCPRGSESVGRFLDNQDGYCQYDIFFWTCYDSKSAIGPGLWPNWQDGNGNTWLYFCMFRRSEDATKMVPHVLGESPFPALGKAYGVYAGQQFVYPEYTNLLHGSIFAEADNDNASTWDFSMMTGPAVENVIGPGPSSNGTLFNVSQAQDCFQGSCSRGVCRAGFADCDGDPYGTGCETTLATDPNNCGACGAVCSSYNVSSTCVAGVCQPGTCSAGWTDCNGNRTLDGCEVALASDVANCGACGTVCSTNHITRSCTNGSCAAGVCAAGYADCNGNKQTDGCETSLSSAYNCGACGRQCYDGVRGVWGTCSSGNCVYPPPPRTCPPGTQNCDGRCYKYCP